VRNSFSNSFYHWRFTSSHHQRRKEARKEGRKGSKAISSESQEGSSKQREGKPAGHGRGREPLGGSVELLMSQKQAKRDAHVAEVVGAVGVCDAAEIREAVQRIAVEPPVVDPVVHHHVRRPVDRDPCREP